MPSGIRKRRAARSDDTAARRKARSKKKTKSKEVTSNPIIAAHWNENETLAQNYRRLGLASKLQTPAGGIEKRIVAAETSARHSEISKKTGVKVGKIVQLEDGTTKIEYADADEDAEVEWEGFGGENEVVKELEAYANSVVPHERHLSEQESSWLVLLVDKYGDDYRAMQWDKKLNPFQHSAGNLKRRIKKLKRD